MIIQHLVILCKRMAAFYQRLIAMLRYVMVSLSVMENDRLLTVDEMAEILQANPAVVRRKIAAGQLPGRKIPGVKGWRCWLSELHAFTLGDQQPARRKSAKYPGDKGIRTTTIKTSPDE